MQNETLREMMELEGVPQEKGKRGWGDDIKETTGAKNVAEQDCCRRKECRLEADRRRRLCDSVRHIQGVPRKVCCAVERTGFEPMSPGCQAALNHSAGTLHFPPFSSLCRRHLTSGCTCSLPFLTRSHD